jgi:hypothetical protein
LTLCNISSLLTRSVQLISVILQHHISNLSRYHQPNNIEWLVKITTLLIMYLSSIVCYFLAHRSNHFPWHPILERLQSVVAFMWSEKKHLEIILFWNAMSHSLTIFPLS